MTWHGLRRSNPPTGTIKHVADSGHVCGKCNWQGKGRDDCPNNKSRLQQWKEALALSRASQTVPYGEDTPDYPESPHAAL